MDCREFQEKHFAFVDDTLPGIELVGMQMHLNDCDRCARQDTMVRRALMLFRSLPSIEPSPEFSIGLRKKLERAKATDAVGSYAGRVRRFATVAALAVTSAAMLGYIMVSLKQVDSPQDIILPPVVASLPESVSPITSPGPAMVASVPAGLPLWPAALFAEQAPAHFISLDLADTDR